MDCYLEKLSSMVREINNKRAFHQHSIFKLIVHIREYLEKNNLKNTYSVTNFYCNWFLHSKIDRNQKAREMLIDLNDIINDNQENHPNDRINEIISLQKLRKELVLIFEPTGIRPIIFHTHKGWKSFLGVFLENLINKPIKLERTLEFGNYISEFKFVRPEYSKEFEEFCKEEGINKNGIYWQITVSPINHFISGPLVNVENIIDNY